MKKKAFSPLELHPVEHERLQRRVGEGLLLYLGQIGVEFAEAAVGAAKAGGLQGLEQMYVL